MTIHSSEQLFRSLVENALDFLNKAISELKDGPKYSVIHFDSAVELFLKARLMQEHWTLIVSKRQEPDWDRFIAGKFNSVSLDEAATRLKQVARSGLSKKERKAFTNVRSHRNHMVHFFHEAQSPEENQQRLKSIAQEQLLAWYFLHRLLRGPWADFFEAWTEQIQKIDSELKKRREFLEVVFKQCEEEIRIRESSGATFQKCPSCGFEADEYTAVQNAPYDTKCLVCNLVRRCLTINCPDCQTLVEFTKEGFAKCDSCGKQLEPSDVAVAIETGPAYIDPKEYDPPLTPAHCGICGDTNSVVETRTSDYFCSNCFEESDSVEFCEYCGDPNTYLSEDSYLSGCQACDGMLVLDDS